MSLDNGTNQTLYVSNTIVADAFDKDTKKKYLDASSFEDQAEIVLENNPYQVVKHLFDKSATRLKKLT